MKRIFCLILTLTLLPLMPLLVLDPERIRWLTREDGLIESLSALAYLMSALAIFYVNRTRPRNAFIVAIPVMALGLRELDFHARFTVMNITRTDFYLEGHVPISEKLMAFSVMAVLLVSLVLLVKRYGRPALMHLKQREPYAVLLGAFLVIGVVTKGLLDGVERKLAAFGLTVGEAGMEPLEECLELTMALALMLAIWQFHRHSRAKGEKPNEGEAA